MQKKAIPLILIALLLKTTTAVEFKPACTSDVECTTSLSSAYFCTEGFCEHKKFSFKNVGDVFGLILVVIISSLAVTIGIGGGTLFVPCYMFVMNYTVGHSTPLSKASILTAAVINILMIFYKRHPYNQNAFVLDYKIATFTVPLILAGTMIGVLFTKLLPSVAIFVILILFLVYSTIMTFIKARKLYKKETIVMKKEEEEKLKDNELEEVVDLETSDIIDKEENKPTEGDEGNNVNGLEKLKEDVSIDRSDANMIQNGSKVEKKEERKSFCQLIKPHLFRIFICIFSYTFLLITSLMRGGKGAESIIGIDACGGVSWVLFALTQVVCIGGSVFIYFLERRSTKKQENNKETKNNNDKEYEEVEDKEGKEDAPHSNLKLFKLLFINSYIAGVLAGTLGIGGGLVINPILIRLNIIPEVSAAVSGFTVLFTGLATTTQYVIAGAFEIDAIYPFLIASVFGAILGNLVIKRLVRKFKRPSLLVWILVALLIFSTVLLPIVGGLRIFEDDTWSKFSSVC